MAATIYLGQETIEIADSLGGLTKNPAPIEEYHNDQYDAFRHAYTSALISQKFGPDVAKWLGDKNEDRHEAPTDPNELKQYNDERNMDSWNNNVGRTESQNWENAKESGTTTKSLEQWIYDKVKDGGTINDLDDKRVWKEPSKPSSPPSPSNGNGPIDDPTQWLLG